MKRSISNKAALLASVAVSLQNRAIEQQGGAWAFDKPNRETRRRMEREARSKKKDKP